jgi:hypothetical protein
MINTSTSSFSQSLARLRRGYIALFALLEDYPEGLNELPGACGTWSPRQILAHLSGWLSESERRYGDFDRGDTQKVRYNHDDDFAEFNRHSVESRAHLDWVETLKDLQVNYQRFVSRADKVPTQQAGADPRYEEWLHGLWEDCIMHLGHLCQFMEAKRGDSAA